jgi:hypothetical protein
MLFADIITAFRCICICHDFFRGTQSLLFSLAGPYKFILFQIFTGIPPWGVLAEKLIFQLVVRENERPERPEAMISERVGLTTPIWEMIESAWHKESVLRPTFQQLASVWPKSAASDPRPVMTQGQ